MSNINDLFKTAQDDGAIGAQSMMAFQIGDMGAQIQAALGVDVDGVSASEVLLVSVLMDDSVSMESGGNDKAARDGHADFLGALLESKARDGVLVCTRLLSGTVIDPFTELVNAKPLDTKNYQATLGHTPLFDEMAVTLGAVVAKTADFSSSGVPCRSVTVIVTDGGNNSSKKQTVKSIKAIVDDMVRAESHIILFIGLNDGWTDFRKLAAEMGIPDRWVLTPKNTRSEFRAAMRVASQSAVRASQGAAGFSQAAQTGFGS